MFKYIKDDYVSQNVALIRQQKDLLVWPVMVVFLEMTMQISLVVSPRTSAIKMLCLQNL